MEKIEATDFLKWKIAKLEAWGGSQEVFVVPMLLEFIEKYYCLLLLLLTYLLHGAGSFLRS